MIPDSSQSHIYEPNDDFHSKIQRLAKEQLNKLPVSLQNGIRTTQTNVQYLLEEDARLPSHMQLAPFAAKALGVLSIAGMLTADNWTAVVAAPVLFSTASAGLIGTAAFVKSMFRISADKALSDLEFQQALNTGEEPEEFIDPITKERIDDPVTDSNDPVQRVFERSSLEKLRETTDHHPVTFKPFGEIVSLPKLRQQIHEFNEKYPE